MTAEHDPPSWLVTRDSARSIESPAPRSSSCPSSKDAPDDAELAFEPAFCVAPTRKL